MIALALFSSKSEEWATPKEVFDLLDNKYHFTLDVCATPENALCDKFFTKEQDGLLQSWVGERVWCNPPYGRQIRAWVERCSLASYRNTENEACFAVMLLPARTDTSWWHDFVLPFGKVTFIRGRLKFGGAKHSAPFPSAIVVFDGDP